MAVMGRSAAILLLLCAATATTAAAMVRCNPLYEQRMLCKARHIYDIWVSEECCYTAATVCCYCYDCCCYG
jgi:hypothetical protein